LLPEKEREPQLSHIPGAVVREASKRRKTRSITKRDKGRRAREGLEERPKPRSRALLFGCGRNN